MTSEVPVADWPNLLRELPAAIKHLRFDNGHCAKEAALLLEGGLFALKTHDPARVWAEVVPIIGMLAIEANDHRRDELPQKTLDFLDRVEDAFNAWLEGSSPVL